MKEERCGEIDLWFARCGRRVSRVSILSTYSLKSYYSDGINGRRIVKFRKTRWTKRESEKRNGEGRKLGSNGEFIGQDTETERGIVKYPKVCSRSTSSLKLASALLSPYNFLFLLRNSFLKWCIVFLHCIDDVMAHCLEFGKKIHVPTPSINRHGSERRNLKSRENNRTAWRESCLRLVKDKQ